jgi:hypothetical protein
MKTLSTYQVGCGGELLHEVAVTGSYQERGSGAVAVDNHVVLLNHDQDMTEAFVAFGAKRPECMVLMRKLREVIDAYQRAATFWTGINWPLFTKGKVLQVNLEGMTADEAEKLLLEAEATENERISAAQDAVREASARTSALSYNHPVNHPLVTNAAEELHKLRKKLTEEVALTEALVNALEQLIHAEAEAAKAAEFGRLSYNAFLRKDFPSAHSLANNADGTEMTSSVPSEHHYWRDYYRALTSLYNYVQLTTDRLKLGLP